MRSTWRLTLVGLLVAGAACMVGGCAEPDEAKQHYTPKMRRVIESSCAKRFTGDKADCRAFATCVMERTPVKRFEAVMEEMEGGTSGPAFDRYLTTLEDCGEEVGIDLDPNYRDSPEFIARHEDAYRPLLTKLLRDEVCLREPTSTKAHCQAWSECMLDELGVQRIYESAMDTLQTETIEPDVDAAWTKCERSSS
jgi:hypothetical protein